VAHAHRPISSPQGRHQRPHRRQQSRRYPRPGHAV